MVVACLAFVVFFVNLPPVDAQLMIVDASVMKYCTTSILRRLKYCA